MLMRGKMYCLWRNNPMQCDVWDPCSYGKVYVGKTTQRLEVRVKEHQNAWSGMTEKLTVAEHVWEYQP